MKRNLLKQNILHILLAKNLHLVDKGFNSCSDETNNSIMNHKYSEVRGSSLTLSTTQIILILYVDTPWHPRTITHGIGRHIAFQNGLICMSSCLTMLKA